MTKSCEMPGVLKPHNGYIPASEYGPGMLEERKRIQSALNRCPHGVNVCRLRCDECGMAGENYQPAGPNATG